MSDIKIIALGGVRENAKNLYIVEINDSIFILDAGLKYPENEQLGVDFVIPNLDYLIENRDRIQGMVPYLISCKKSKHQFLDHHSQLSWLSFL